MTDIANSHVDVTTIASREDLTVAFAQAFTDLEDNAARQGEVVIWSTVKVETEDQYYVTRSFSEPAERLERRIAYITAHTINTETDLA